MRSPLLRRALIGNALFSLLSGLVLVGFSGSVSRWMGAVAPGLLQVTGAGLLGFAAFLLWEARRPSLRPDRAWIATLADFGWVIGSAVVLLLPLPALSAAGRWAIVLVAAVVLLFAVLQLAGLRDLTRNRRGTTAARSAFEVQRQVAAPADVVWRLVRDLGRIGEVYPEPLDVEVQGTRLDARRTCENRRGERWSEDVVAWDEEARAFTLRFDTDAPDFPFPVREMYGGWQIDAVGDAASVVVWYEYTMRGGLLGEFLAPLLARRTERLMTATITNLEAAARQMAEDPSPAGAETPDRPSETRPKNRGDVPAAPAEDSTMSDAD
ncbi:MAG: hypothetical protein GVY18_11720 [Bacteroidetes bacterium]|jgi:hypothetical protein|nr:hypothetical protein [Bacteroidota bacterium]